MYTVITFLLHQTSQESEYIRERERQTKNVLKCQSHGHSTASCIVSVYCTVTCWDYSILDWLASLKNKDWRRSSDTKVDISKSHLDSTHHQNSWKHTLPHLWDLLVPWSEPYGPGPMVVKEKWIKVIKIDDHFYVLNLSCTLPTVSDLAHRHWSTILTLHYNQRLLKVAMWLQTVLSLFFVRLHMYYCKQYSQASSEVFVDWKISK